MTSEQYKLIYFNVKGLAETSRILFALGNIKYKDFRFPFNIIDSKNHIYEKKEFEKIKNEGKLKISMNKLPILEITTSDGKRHYIPQSKSIERYIAKKCNLMGSNEIEEARVDAICECIRDIKERYKMHEDKESYFEDMFENELNLLVDVFDKDKLYCVGDKLSLADVLLYTFITQYFTEDNKNRSLDISSNNYRIRNIVIKVAECPEVIEWLNKRPDTVF